MTKRIVPQILDTLYRQLEAAQVTLGKLRRDLGQGTAVGDLSPGGTRAAMTAALRMIENRRAAPNTSMGVKYSASRLGISSLTYSFAR